MHRESDPWRVPPLNNREIAYVGGDFDVHSSPDPLARSWSKPTELLH